MTAIIWQKGLYLHRASVGVYSLGSNVHSLNSSPLLSNVNCWFPHAGSSPKLISQMPKNRQVGGRNSLIDHFLQRCLLFFYFLLFCPLDWGSLPDSRLPSLHFRLPSCLPTFWPGGVVLLLWQYVCLVCWLLTQSDSWYLCLSSCLFMYSFTSPWHTEISLSQQFAQSSWPHSNDRVLLVSSALLVKNRAYNKGNVEINKYIYTFEIMRI